MDIVTIYGQPDEQEPTKAFEGLMKSFKKWGFRKCDRLVLVGPNFEGERKEKVEKMLSLVCDDRWVYLGVSYRNARHGRSLAQYHNYCFCMAKRAMSEVLSGKFLYIPFGCEPNEKNWGKTVEAVVYTHPEHSFIGETRIGANGFPYLSGACVLSSDFLNKSTGFQAVHSKIYILERVNKACRGGVKHYNLPFTSIELDGEKVEPVFMEKGKLEKPVKVAEAMLDDVKDDVGEGLDEAVEAAVAPDPEPEPEAPDTFLVDELDEVISQERYKEEKEETDSFFKPKKKAAKKAGKKKTAKKKTAKKAGKKKIGKKVAKKAVAKEGESDGEPEKEKPKSVSVGFNDAFPRAEKRERPDHTK